MQAFEEKNNLLQLLWKKIVEGMDDNKIDGWLEWNVYENLWLALELGSVVLLFSVSMPNMSVILSGDPPLSIYILQSMCEAQEIRQPNPQFT